MRNITKLDAPNCLTLHKRTPHASYENLSAVCREEVVARLHKEQGGICCYCMSGINLEHRKSYSIEHWRPQAACTGEHAGEDLDYANMLLVCGGGKELPARATHCDVSKGDKTIKFNPSHPGHDVESLIRYHKDGNIACPADKVFEDQLTKVLKLNVKHLAENRRRVIKRTIQETGGASLSELKEKRKRISRPNLDGILRPYCMAAVYFIDRKIRQRESQAKQ